MSKDTEHLRGQHHMGRTEVLREYHGINGLSTMVPEKDYEPTHNFPYTVRALPLGGHGWAVVIHEEHEIGEIQQLSKQAVGYPMTKFQATTRRSQQHPKGRKSDIAIQTIDGGIEWLLLQYLKEKYEPNNR